MDYAHLILSLHVFSAIALGSTLGVSAMALYKKDSQYYRPLAITLAGVVFSVVLTGVGTLTVLPSSGVIQFCAKMGLFVTLTAIIEYMFWQRLQAAEVVE